MDLAMFGEPEFIFKVDLKPYCDIQADEIEIPLILVSALERVALDPEAKFKEWGISFN